MFAGRGSAACSLPGLPTTLQRSVVESSDNLSKLSHYFAVGQGLFELLNAGIAHLRSPDP